MAVAAAAVAEAVSEEMHHRHHHRSRFQTPLRCCRDICTFTVDRRSRYDPRPSLGLDTVYSL